MKPVVVLLLALLLSSTVLAERQRIKAIGIPLADHYAAILAYEKYREQMQHADFQLLILPGPELVRAYFRSEADADLALLVSPMVMDMFARKPDFRWVSLIHRDGNALAVNSYFKRDFPLPADKRERRADAGFAEAISRFKARTGRPMEIAVPSLLATHTSILYKYLKDHGKRFGLRHETDVDVLLRILKPPLSPVYLKRHAVRSRPAALEQSLPWPDIAETAGHGYVAWYSRDVLRHPQGHVECVIIAKDQVIAQKGQALREVIHYIHRAGRDLETARHQGGDALHAVIALIRKHVPAHSEDAIRESLRADLNVINYLNLNVDANAKSSFQVIMELAREAGFIRQLVDIESLANGDFATDVTVSTK
jgi:NitT/TauT family transport system substrate-binding protein